MIQPSDRPDGDRASASAGGMPRSLRTLLRTIGALEARGGLLVSYLLFESAYTTRTDATWTRPTRMARRTEIEAYLALDSTSAPASRGRAARRNRSTSVTVVTMTPPATAGSTPNRFSTSGTATPASAAATRFTTIAAKMTAEMLQLRNQSTRDDRHDASPTPVRSAARRRFPWSSASARWRARPGPAQGRARSASASAWRRRRPCWRRSASAPRGRRCSGSWSRTGRRPRPRGMPWRD